MNLNEVLKESPLFQALSADAQRVLLETGRLQRFEPDAQILKTGDRGDSMHVIVEGLARVQIPIRTGESRGPVVLREGDFFGEMALLTGDPRNADVFADATRGATTFVVTKPVVERLCSDHPQVARFLTEILGRRLQEGGHIRQVGKYRLHTELGRGGMAIVYEAWDETLKRPVAVKMLPHDLIYEADFLIRFRREAQTIARLRHEHIVQVYDITEHFSTQFIVMELLNGQDLETRLRESGPLSFSDTRRILRQVASALRYAHSLGVVHRDVKPSNIFLQADGNAKLLDFGIAARKDLGDAMAQLGDPVGKFAGTPEFSSPEAILGKAVDERSDIYSLGLVAYAMLTNDQPFVGSTVTETLRNQLISRLPSLRKRIHDLPDDLADFIDGATAKKAEQRFRNCADVINSLADPTQPQIATLDSTMLTVLYDTPKRARVEEVLHEARLRLEEIGVHYVKFGHTDV